MQRTPARAVGLALALAVSLTVAACSSNGRPPTAGARAPGSTRASAASTASTHPQADWVVAENQRKGTAGWRISGAAAGIEGYSNAIEATQGQVVTLYVSTASRDFRAELYRMGYYQGLGARLVWTSSRQTGVMQAPCPLTPGVNMVQCHWSPSLTFTISEAMPQGEYLIKLVGSGDKMSYVPLTVWDPSSSAAIVIMDGSLTDQVFNAYGGADLYQGVTPCAARIYPCSTRARVVSFDRPYRGQGDGGYLGLTYPLTRLAEQHGLDVTYWTDLTLAEHGDLLTRHAVLLSPGHDEEWSRAMRQATTAAIAHGVNVAFFGASPVLRKVRLQPSALGPDRQIVNYRDPRADPEYGHDNAEVSQNSWDQAPAADPSSRLVGATYIGYNNANTAPLVVTNPHSWLFAGTHLRKGSSVPGVMFSDFQAYQASQSGPRNVAIQAHSPVQVLLHGTQFADTSYYTTPSGAGVWQSGTNGWIPAIGVCSQGDVCASRLVQIMTLNVLAELGRGPLGRRFPS